MKKPGIVWSILVGSVLSATTMAIGFYLSVANDDGGSGFVFDAASDWAWVWLIIGVVSGIVLGGLTGLLLWSFKLGVLKSLAFGGILHFLIVIFVLFLAGGGGMSKGITYLIYTFIAVGLLNAAVVSILTIPKNLK